MKKLFFIFLTLLILVGCSPTVDPKPIEETKSVDELLEEKDYAKAYEIASDDRKDEIVLLWEKNCLETRVYTYIAEAAVSNNIVKEYLENIYTFLDSNDNLNAQELDVVDKLLMRYEKQYSRNQTFIYFVNKIIWAKKTNNEDANKKIDSYITSALIVIYNENNIESFETNLKILEKCDIDLLEYSYLLYLVGGVGNVKNGLNEHLNLINNFLKKNGKDDLITHYIDVVLSKNREIYIEDEIDKAQIYATENSKNNINEPSGNYYERVYELRILNDVLYLNRGYGTMYSHFLNPILHISENLKPTTAYSNGYYYFVDGNDVFRIDRKMWDNKENVYRKWESENVYQHENINTIDVVNDNLVCLLDDNSVVKYNMKTKETDTATFTDWDSIIEWAK